MFASRIRSGHRRVLMGCFFGSGTCTIIGWALHSVVIGQCLHRTVSHHLKAKSIFSGDSCFGCGWMVLK